MVKEMCSILYKEIKHKCKGKITVQPLFKGSTTVVIQIENQNETFTTYIDDIIDKMYKGFDTKESTKDLLAKYKQCLLFRYFY